MVLTVPPRAAETKANGKEKGADFEGLGYMSIPPCTLGVNAGTKYLWLPVRSSQRLCDS